MRVNLINNDSSSTDIKGRFNENEDVKKGTRAICSVHKIPFFISYSCKYSRCSMSVFGKELEIRALCICWLPLNVALRMRRLECRLATSLSSHLFFFFFFFFFFLLLPLLLLLLLFLPLERHGLKTYAGIITIIIIIIIISIVSFSYT